MNKTLQHNNLKTKTVMSAKILVFIFCVKKVIYLLLYHLHDCTFKLSPCNTVFYNFRGFASTLRHISLNMGRL